MTRATMVLVTILASVWTDASAQDRPLDRLDFFIGEWDLVTTDIQPNGRLSEGRARADAYRILDGTAIQDDFRQLDDGGRVVFRGTSIRSFDHERGVYRIVWIMPGVEGLTELTGRFEEGDFVMAGAGYDGSGRFLEKARYFDITHDSWAFTMKRSYDGGETWIDPFGTIRARRAPRQIRMIGN